MRRTVSNASPSSAAHPVGASAHEHEKALTRTRKAQYERPSTAQYLGEVPPSQGTPERQQPPNSASSVVPPTTNNAGSSAPKRKPPAYLQGKNPYGQVLERVDHIYRAPRDTTAEDALSQKNAPAEGRPRTSGSFMFKARAPQVRPVQTVVKDPIVSTESNEVSKTSTVQATRNFFETNARGQRPPKPPAPYTAALNKISAVEQPLRDSHVAPPKVSHPPAQTSASTEFRLLPRAQAGDQNSNARTETEGTRDAQNTYNQPVESVDKSQSVRQRRSSEETVKHRSTHTQSLQIKHEDTPDLNDDEILSQRTTAACDSQQSVNFRLARRKSSRRRLGFNETKSSFTTRKSTTNF